jgi:hypothetical protein
MAARFRSAVAAAGGSAEEHDDNAAVALGGANRTSITRQTGGTC